MVLHMARVATKLTPTKSGGFTARKRIPEDVQAAYQEHYEVRWEERLTIAPATPILLARAKHREWLSEIESRIANIRAERKGEGRLLTPKDARALAGEWYQWFTQRHLERAQSVGHWQDLLERVSDALRDEVLPHADLSQEANEIDDIWERSAAARERVRPMLADWGETSQFLMVRRMVLDASSRDLFLDHLYGDFAAALRLLIARAKGDWTEDTHPRQFPKLDDARDAGQGPWQLFELWVGAAKPATATVNRWRAVFLDLGGSLVASGNRCPTMFRRNFPTVFADVASALMVSPLLDWIIRNSIPSSPTASLRPSRLPMMRTPLRD